MLISKIEAKPIIEPMSAEPATLEQVAAQVLRLRDRVEDLEGLRDLNAAVQRDADKPGTPWEEVCAEFGWDFKRESDPKNNR